MRYMLARGMVLLALGLLFVPSALGQAAPKKGSPIQPKVLPIPSYAEIERTVQQYFTPKRDARSRRRDEADESEFQPTDIITRQDVSPLLTQLKKQGLPLPDEADILAKLPSEGEFLVETLRGSEDGRTFMRQVAQFDLGYDRVDRLSRMARGRKNVQDLIAGPDGYKMIQYMTTSSGGKELGAMLGDSPRGSDFNAPTGRIYNVPMLLERLEASRAASVKAAAKKGGRPAR